MSLDQLEQEISEIQNGTPTEIVEQDAPNTQETSARLRGVREANARTTNMRDCVLSTFRDAYAGEDNDLFVYDDPENPRAFVIQHGKDRFEVSLRKLHSKERSKDPVDNTLSVEERKAIRLAIRQAKVELKEKAKAEKAAAREAKRLAKAQAKAQAKTTASASKTLKQLKPITPMPVPKTQLRPLTTSLRPLNPKLQTSPVRNVPPMRPSTPDELEFDAHLFPEDTVEVDSNRIMLNED